ncbi:MAG: GNAT family N-acetyltransferase [Anaerolineaceae bacterium]|nr:GNAT family N-acetyltransferase [Anaerolineaceae bacterium]
MQAGAELVSLQLETLFVFDARGSILSTREPHATAGPFFMLIRSTVDVRWAIRTDVSQVVADELNLLAREEPPLSDLHNAPIHADRYQSLLGNRTHSGPAFKFPQAIIQPADVVLVEDEQLLDRHFKGWIPGEIRAGRAPMLAVLDHGDPVSICFSARRSNKAVEAGVETAPEFQGRGLGQRVVAAWALAVRSSGQIPLYSTDWSNAASLAVARKLGLEVYAVDWSISD